MLGKYALTFSLTAYNRAVMKNVFLGI